MLHTCVLIPGDGIGPEVIAAGLQALDVLAARDGGFEVDAGDRRQGGQPGEDIGELVGEFVLLAPTQGAGQLTDLRRALGFDRVL